MFNFSDLLAGVELPVWIFEIHDDVHFSYDEDEVVISLGWIPPRKLNSTVRSSNPDPIVRFLAQAHLIS